MIASCVQLLKYKLNGKEFNLNFFKTCLDNGGQYKLPFEKKIGLHVPKIDREMKNEIINFIKSKPDIGTFILSDDYAKRQINYEIKNQLPENSIIVEYKNPWFLTALIKQIDLVITTKLHVGIVANALNTQVLSIPFHNKTPRFYEQIGKSDYCIPFNQYSKGSIKDMLEYMYLNCSNKHISPEVKKKAYRNKELISEFINLIKRF